MLQRGCKTGRARATGVVKNDITGIGVCQHEVTQEVERLLGRVQDGLLMLFPDADDTHGKLLAWVCRQHFLYLLVVVIEATAFVLAVTVVRLLVITPPCGWLGSPMVICGLYTGNDL